MDSFQIFRALFVGALFLSACSDVEGPTSTSTSTSTTGGQGQGGQGQGGQDQGGGGSACVTCSEGLSQGDNGLPVCEGSAAAYDALKACMCADMNDANDCFDDCKQWCTSPGNYNDCVAGCPELAELCASETDVCKADQ